MFGTECTLRKQTIGDYDPTSDSRETTTVDHVLTGVLVSGWRNVRLHKEGWQRVRQVTIPASSLPAGVEPTETDQLLFEGAVWSIAEITRPEPRVAFFLSAFLT